MHDAGGVSHLLGFLDRLGLLAEGERPRFVALTGGVSSDIHRVELRQGPVCVKRALAKLKVRADWQAPVERNRYEVAWLEVAGRIAPRAVPQLLGHDEGLGLFAMEYFDPGRYRLWKEDLRRGIADVAFAAQVGAVLTGIHAGTAADIAVSERFPTDQIFHAIRLEPYLEATALRHPDLKAPLLDLAMTTAANKRALVHGDVSPKNILIGPDGPVLLDAECAWYGDPAFDLAFCLNHLLLKCLWVPEARDGFLACYDALAAAYRRGISWESPQALERRAAHLLPGLFLARVDGKSPVEYLADEASKARVRKVGRALLEDPRDRLGDIRAAWERELAS